MYRAYIHRVKITVFFKGMLGEGTVFRKHTEYHKYEYKFKANSDRALEMDNFTQQIIQNL